MTNEHETMASRLSFWLSITGIVIGVLLTALASGSYVELREARQAANNLSIDMAAIRVSLAEINRRLDRRDSALTRRETQVDKRLDQIEQRLWPPTAIQ